MYLIELFYCLMFSTLFVSIAKFRIMLVYQSIVGADHGYRGCHVPETPFKIGAQDPRQKADSAEGSCP